jgi:hypothetical protein
MNQRTPTAKQIAKWLGMLGLICLALFASLWIFLLYSPSPYREKNKAEAESVVQKFHDGYNADQLDKVCEAVYGCSLSSSVKDSWNSYVQQVRDRAGSFKSVTSSKVQVYIEPPGVRATYVSSFEKTECTEIFDLHGFDVPLKDGGSTQGPLKIMRYRVLIDSKQIPVP